MNLGEWLGVQAREFRERNNRERVRMLECYLHAYQSREKDPDQAFNAFTEGKHLAEQLGEPWWALFYENERIEALLHFKRDYRNVLEMAVQCVLEVRKPANALYPGRFSIWDSLVAAYLGIDADGYAEPIQQALDYLDREIPPEPEGARYLLLARLTTFALERERLEEAYDGCMRELKLCAEDHEHSRALHFATFTYCDLCEIAGRAGAWEPLGQWSATGEELARQVGHHCELAEVLAWQAVAAVQAGDRDRAQRAYQNAVTHIGRLKMPPKRGYFDALVLYHEKNEDLERALTVRDEELTTIADRGRLLSEARVHLQRCGLLARLARLEESDLETARTAAGRLRKADPYLAQIRELAEGL
jgi:hypothetical protein